MANFVNPAYATPAQIESMRRYAAQLMQPSDVRHPLQGVGDVVRALVGGSIGAQAGEQERAGAAEFGKRLLEATSSKDPAKAMELMSDPRAAPIQALLLKTLMEWGPPEGVTLPGGISAHRPSGPWFGGGEKVPPVTPVIQGAALPPAKVAPAPYQSAVGEPIPESRTTEGATDAEINALGARYGIPNAAKLSRAGMEMAAEQKRQETRAALETGQQVKGEGTREIVGNLRANLLSDIPEAIKIIDKNPHSTTGKVAWMSANVPDSPAFRAAEVLKKIEGGALQHEIQTVENAEQRRLSPAETDAIRARLGIGQNQDYATLRRNLVNLQKRYLATGTWATTPGEPANLTPQPGQAQAGEQPGNDAFVIHGVTPLKTWQNRNQ
jgi:hypothetical protein